LSLPLYHMDFVGMIFTLAGSWFVSKKRWWGWVLSAIGNSAFMYVNAAVRLWTLEPMAMTFIVISIRSAFLWRRAVTHP
jgi:nicotinamide riboside transporter PnuC